jgi:putative transposase
MNQMQAAFEASGRCYGSRRMVDALAKQDIHVGRYRVRRLTHENALKPVWKRKFVHTTDSRHDLPVFDNVLNRRFTALWQG